MFSSALVYELAVLKLYAEPLLFSIPRDVPEYDEAKTVESTVEIAVQINGKTRATLSIGKDDAKEDVLAKAKETIADKLEGKNIIKEIYVPGRIVNIVAK